MDTERQNKFYFLDVEVIREQGKFKTTIYHKPIFSSLCSNFENFLPFVYILGKVYTLVYRCFRIFSDWTELTFLKRYFAKMVTLETLLVSVLKSF